MPKSVQTIFQEFIEKKKPIFQNREALTSHFTPETIRKMSNLDIEKITTMLAIYNKVQNLNYYTINNLCLDRRNDNKPDIPLRFDNYTTGNF